MAKIINTTKHHSSDICHRGGFGRFVMLISVFLAENILLNKLKLLLEK
jgi:hypothetical protein